MLTTQGQLSIEHSGCSQICRMHRTNRASPVLPLPRTAICRIAKKISRSKDAKTGRTKRDLTVEPPRKSMNRASAHLNTSNGIKQANRRLDETFWFDYYHHSTMPISSGITRRLGLGVLSTNSKSRKAPMIFIHNLTWPCFARAISVPLPLANVPRSMAKILAVFFPLVVLSASTFGSLATNFWVQCQRQV
jgi:hypothetical protein